MASGLSVDGVDTVADRGTVSTPSTVREGAQRQPAEDEALVLPERGDCEERTDPGAGAAPAETKQLQWSTRPARGAVRGRGARPGKYKTQNEKCRMTNDKRPMRFR